MSKKLSTDETSLIGSWVEKRGTLKQDAVCERIQWLIDSYFKQVAVDGDNWSALYINPDDGSYWELTYPYSHMHGGGPPTLQRITKDHAKKRYVIGSG
ncbi:Imm27 family immunity protein [Salinispirillum marinum]|uniref:Imm27 family immunity protein n=2 Tax=Saccharospirillaceae TaxID=255527 RepID=A0ABV8BDU8_9GAMM